MRIALVHHKLNNKGGAENIVMWLADGLRRRGHDITVIAQSFDRSLWPQEITEGIPVKLIRCRREIGPLKSRRIQQWRFSRALSRTLTNYDIVVANHPPTPHACVKARDVRKENWPIVWMCQEPKRLIYRKITDKHLLNWKKYSPAGISNEHLNHYTENKSIPKRIDHRLKARRSRNWDRKAASLCDLVVANSHFSASNIKEAFGVNPEPCHLGVPIPESLPYVLGNYVGVLTTLNATKNVDNIIRAIAELVQRGITDIPLHIAGKGPDRLRLENVVRDLGIDRQVKFVGAIPDEDLHEFYRNARVVVYCPIDEPFGLVPIEAQAAQTPVIVSNHGGPTEIVDDGVTGLHVNPFDPSAIADAIATLWNDTDRNQRMAQAASEKSRTQFSLRSFLSRFEALLYQCVNASAGPVSTTKESLNITPLAGEKG